jgi:hypothetical protein
MPRALHVGLAIWPRKSGQWFELGLKSTPDLKVSLLSNERIESGARLDLLVMDGDNPGPGFAANYADYLKSFGPCDLIVLGQPESPSLMSTDWDPLRTFFVAKPYLIEDALKTIHHRLGEVVLRESSAVVPPPPHSSAALPPPRPPVSPARAKSLGYLSTLRLADLIQMLCLSNWTGRIDIENLATGDKGYVSLEDGAVRDAQQNLHEGETACYHMLSWGRCQFEFTEDVAPTRVTMNSLWQQILLEGARMFDEGLLKP